MPNVENSNVRADSHCRYDIFKTHLVLCWSVYFNTFVSEYSRFSEYFKSHLCLLGVLFSLCGQAMFKVRVCVRVHVRVPRVQLLYIHIITCSLQFIG